MAASAAVPVNGESKLGLDPGMVAACHEAARAVAGTVAEETAGRSTVSVERAIARMLGVDGADEHGVPLVNVLVDHLAASGFLATGIALPLGAAMAATGRTPGELARAVAAGELALGLPAPDDEDAARRAVASRAEECMAACARRMEARRALRERLGEGTAPRRYVLTATGDVHEDVVHALAVAEHGGDIVAVIRSTAQSVLDHVPHGATTEGYGGTFATQENFRIMRRALDEWSAANGRYVRLSSFCSGLCMPEIAVIGALEGFDNMVNDALYGILYRDINVRRTLIDQRFSRRINGHFGVVINTGEDNYLRTAEPIAAAPSVIASQFINLHLALSCGVPEEQVALGHAFEIHPDTTNGLLLEWAQAQLTRELFPSCPVKYMPPTKHMDGDALRTHACNALFNLVAVGSRQEIQTIGMPSEGTFTPHLHDRMLGLDGARYVANFARDLGEEISFRPGGIVQTRACTVLADALALLERIASDGLFDALRRGVFGDVRRRPSAGRGGEGVLEVAPGYLDPCSELMAGAPVG